MNPNQQQYPNQPQYQQNIIVVGKQKSVGVAFILAFFFGPLGLFYASVSGGIIMCILTLVIGVITLFGLIFTQIVCIIWAVVAANNENQKQANGAIQNYNTSGKGTLQTSIAESNIYLELEKLGDLKSKDAITEDEFNKLKEAILSRH